MKNECFAYGAMNEAYGWRHREAQALWSVWLVPKAANI